jgi:hypothetical protein
MTFYLCQANLLNAFNPERLLQGGSSYFSLPIGPARSRPGLTVQPTGLSSYFSKKHKMLMIRHFDEFQRNFSISSGVLNYRFDPDP